MELKYTYFAVSICLGLCCGLSAAQVQILKPLSIHVLDTMSGTDAPGMKCELFKKRQNRNSFQLIATNATDSRGRADLLPVNEIGIYRLRLHTRNYFSAKGLDTFWPIWDCTFNVSDAYVDNHVPVTFSQFGFTTYRGSSF